MKEDGIYCIDTRSVVIIIVHIKQGPIVIHIPNKLKHLISFVGQYVYCHWHIIILEDKQ